MFSSLFMEMNMHVRLPVMAVLVQVNIRTSAQHARDCEHPQPDDHQRYAKLQPVCHPLGNRNAKDQNQHADQDQRRCMSDPPQATDKR